MSTTTYSIGSIDEALPLAAVTGLASLPVSLRPVTGDDTIADIVAVDGTTSGWAARGESAIRAGARAMLVIAPTPVDTAAARSLSDLATSSGVPVIIDNAWASNPAVSPFSASIPQGFAARLIESDATFASDDLLGALIDHVVLLRAVVPGEVEVLSATESTGSYSLVLRFDETLVSVIGTRTAVADGAATVTVFGGEAEFGIRIPDPATAAPAVSTRMDESGKLTLPTIYESAHRSSLLRAIAALNDGATTPDLDEWITAATIADAIHEHVGNSEGAAA